MPLFKMRNGALCGIHAHRLERKEGVGFDLRVALAIPERWERSKGSPNLARGAFIAR
jgi:hypothetical protein